MSAGGARAEEGPRYAVGIDLGTTHCALHAIDLSVSEGEEVLSELLQVPQAISPGSIEGRSLLPSFLYVPHAEELPEGALSLPWEAAPRFAVGELARELGQKTPLRLVSSAKSWLCHPGVDRRSPILPVGAPAEVPQLSPLQASIFYLEHLRSAWEAAHPEAPLDEQEVVITVPASFDPAARELTAEAAREAGYEKLVLLEEPQAALYAWLEQSEGAWREQVEVGDLILVVDIGGGTTDFSLIAVQESEGALELRRVAVGEHILLGGDNMDFALAALIQNKLKKQGKKLGPHTLQGLAQSCRKAKEAILAGEEESVPVVVAARGSKLIGGTLRSELTKAEVETVLVEGFFPEVGVEEEPRRRPRGALTKMGLPYAQDPGITRHLAAFLRRQVNATQDLRGFPEPPVGATFLHPTAVLVNGGVLKAKALCDRLLRVLSGWLRAEGSFEARLLEGADLDHAVARGAAYYGHVRRGGGVRIRGGTAQSYYVGVEAAMPAIPGLEPPLSALCVAPFGIEEGTLLEPAPQEFGLIVGEPVHFRFFGSSVRREDEVGTLLEDWEEDGELEPMGEIEANLPAETRAPGEVVPVRIAAGVTEVGTLELIAIPRDGEERWKIELDLRGEAPEEVLLMEEALEDDSGAVLVVGDDEEE